MANQHSINPTESELEILQLLWEDGSASVREINDKLNEKRIVGYTTTLKILQIMTEKGIVSRNTDQRTHIYKAELQEKSTKTRLLNDFLDSTYKGSAMNLVMQTLGNHKTTSAELEEIKALISQIENKIKS